MGLLNSARLPMDGRGDASRVVFALMGDLDWLCACEALYPKLRRARLSYICLKVTISELSKGAKCP